MSAAVQHPFVSETTGSLSASNSHLFRSDLVLENFKSSSSSSSSSSSLSKSALFRFANTDFEASCHSGLDLTTGRIALGILLRSMSHICSCATSFRFRNGCPLVAIQLAPFLHRFSFRRFQVFIVIFITLKKWPLSLCRYRFRGILSFRTGPNHRSHCTWHLFEINVKCCLLCLPFRNCIAFLVKSRLPATPQCSRWQILKLST